MDRRLIMCEDVLQVCKLQAQRRGGGEDFKYYSYELLQ